jgi:hypothetical protein
MDSDKWIKETTKLPINDYALAKNYLTAMYGSNIILGQNTLNLILTRECKLKLIDAGNLTANRKSDFLFTNK